MGELGFRTLEPPHDLSKVFDINRNKADHLRLADVAETVE